MKQEIFYYYTPAQEEVIQIIEPHFQGVVQTTIDDLLANKDTQQGVLNHLRTLILDEPSAVYFQGNPLSNFQRGFRQMIAQNIKDRGQRRFSEWISRLAEDESQKQEQFTNDILKMTIAHCIESWSRRDDEGGDSMLLSSVIRMTQREDMRIDSLYGAVALSAQQSVAERFLADVVGHKEDLLRFLNPQ